jgi:hypothetical protein
MSCARKAVLGQNPPEIAYWERGEWWLARCETVAPRGSDRRQRPTGVPPAPRAGGVVGPGGGNEAEAGPPSCLKLQVRRWAMDAANSEPTMS